MEFNIQKYLMENKLTLQSYMREEDDILEPQLANDDFEDADIDDTEDSWNKPDPDDSEDFEQQPVQPEEPVDRGEDISGEEERELDKLKAYLKTLIQQYKQNLISIEDYKEKVYHDVNYGNIIKKIKSLEKKFYPQVSLGDEEGNEEI
jgi:hypothetical protein